MKDINIVFICDNKFALPTGVAIQSIINNKKYDNIYNIYILTDKLSEDNLLKLNRFNRDDIRIIITFFDSNNYESLHKYDKYAPTHVTLAALQKFEIPKLFPALDKVLYLDGDIIIKREIETLFDTEIENFYAGVILDSGRLYYTRENTSYIKDYFNSGVMLLNLKKMREDNISEMLFEEKSKQTDFTLVDQDVFNIVFKDKIKLLDIKYNFLGLNLFREKNKFSISAINKLYNTSYKDFKDLEKNAVIIHFASKEKPWLYMNTRYSSLWLSVYKKSPFYDKKNILQNKKIKYETIFTNLESEIKLLKLLFKNRNKNIVFWGASLFLEKFLKKYHIKQKNILGIIDKNLSRQGELIYNYKIFNVSDISVLNPDCVIFVIKNNSNKIYPYVKDYLNENYSNIELLPNIFEVNE